MEREGWREGENIFHPVGAKLQTSHVVSSSAAAALGINYLRPLPPLASVGNRDELSSDKPILSFLDLFPYTYQRNLAFFRQVQVNSDT